MLRSFYAVVAIAAVFFPSMVVARESVSLADSWKFAKGDFALTAPATDWEQVTVPHTWNALDGQNGKKADPQYPDGYYRGPAWYEKQLNIPARWNGQRIFVRFGAASLVADVYLNGQHLGQHRGAFAAFCYELTPHLAFGSENVLRVRVDNSHTEEVMPLSGDFTVFGGIYRPVQLLVAAPVCITPLDYATSGVYVTTRQAHADSATIEVATKISSALAETAAAVVSTELIDAAGEVVHTATVDITAKPAGATTAQQTITIERPHLWSGRKDPYLYTLRTKLLRDGQAVDQVEQTIGLRSAIIDNERGFLLNGEPYPVHGVNRHQERQDKGWALSRAEHEEDFRIITEIGATAVRLAHYQQSEEVHEICDRAGFVTWEEIPNVERVSGSAAFAENAREQLTEMILQGYNRPSIVWRGIFNELNASWIKPPGAPVDPVPLLKTLSNVAKNLDPARPVVAASWTTDPLPMHQIADWQCYNTYPGWYWGKIEDFASVITKGSKAIGGKRTAISEYGAGANPEHHQEGKLKPPKHDGQFHPEEYQAQTHETQWALAKGNPKLWGTFVWAMFDFASDKRDEGARPGVNDKGLVTHDRRLRKDAFYFYQANWTEEPMIYISARRMTARKQAVTEVKAYSNCSRLELFVNGKSVGSVVPDSVRIARWKGVRLQPGKNTIEVKAERDGRTVQDACEWTLATSR